MRIAGGEPHGTITSLSTFAFTGTGTALYSALMDLEQFLFVLGMVAVLAAALFLPRFFSAECRERRRRQRNYGRTIQKANRPMVKFTVKTPDEKK